MKKWMLILIAILILAACGNDEANSPQLEGANDGNSDTISIEANANHTATPAPLANITLDGTVLFRQGLTLHQLSIENGAPQVSIVAENVREEIFVSPSKKHLIFADQDLSGSVYLAEPTTNNHQKLVGFERFTGGFWSVETWSPDEEIVVLRLSGRYYFVDRNGVERFQIISRSTFYQVLWVSNTEIILMSLEFRGGGSNEQGTTILQSLEHVDLSTSESTPVDADLEALSEEMNNGYSIWEFLAESGYEVISSNVASSGRYFPSNENGVFGGPTVFCDTWSLDYFADEGQQISVYQNDNVLRLDSVLTTDTDKTYFLEWVLPTCDVDRPNVSLNVVQNDAVTTITTDVFGGVGFSGLNGDNFFRNPAPTLYQISPDESSLLWISGEPDQSTAIHHYDIDAMNQTMLYDESLDISSSNFIEAVYWLAD